MLEVFLYAVLLISGLFIGLTVAFYTWYASLESTKLYNRLPNIKVHPIITYWKELKKMYSAKQPLVYFNQYLCAFCKAYEREKICLAWIAILPVVFFFKPETVEVLLNNSAMNTKSTEYRFLEPWLGTGLLTSSNSNSNNNSSNNNSNSSSNSNSNNNSSSSSSSSSSSNNSNNNNNSNSSSSSSSSSNSSSSNSSSSSSSSNSNNSSNNNSSSSSSSSSSSNNNNNNSNSNSSSNSNNSSNNNSSSSSSSSNSNNNNNSNSSSSSSSSNSSSSSSSSSSSNSNNNNNNSNNNSSNNSSSSNKSNSSNSSSNNNNNNSSSSSSSSSNSSNSSSSNSSNSSSSNSNNSNNSNNNSSNNNSSNNNSSNNKSSNNKSNSNNSNSSSKRCSGEKWRTRRKLLTPSFHFRILMDFLVIFNEQSQVLVKKIGSLGSNSATDIVPLIKMCTLDIICETAMGVHINAQLGGCSEYVTAINEISDTFIYRLLRPWLWNEFIYCYFFPSGWKHRKNLNLVHQFTRKMIKEKKEFLLKNYTSQSKNEMETRRKAFLELLLENHFKDDKFTEEDVREEVDTFMFEGHDTTTMGISWALYNLGLYPDIQRKVIEELDSILQEDKERSISFDDLSAMKYMECVIKESLRLFPPVTFIGRNLNETITVLNYEIPAGTNCVIVISMIHRDPEMFPNPEKFDPDRFLPENSVGRHPFAYIPFSAGPRNCIGQKFALMEEKVVIAQILRKFQLISLDPLDRIDIMTGLVSKNVQPLRMRFIPRD